MKDHVIVCGAGTTGRHIIEELVASGVNVVAIDANQQALEELADKFGTRHFSYVLGDATDDELLAQTNVATARGIVAALSSDKDNLYLVVSARQTNPRARIIARAAELSHIEKIRRAGADSVVSPNHIGGMRMVSELLRPAVVRFLDEMLRDKRAAYRIEEVRIAGGNVVGQTLREARIRERFGMTVLALRPSDDAPWIYNPDATEALRAGMTLVVLGSANQVHDLRAAAT